MDKLIIERTVVLSTNDNPDYLKYLKWCQQAWNKIGWKTLCFYYGDMFKMPHESDGNKIVYLKTHDFKLYRPETIVQCIRLLAGNYIDRGLIITGDVDMLPVMDYWNPDPDQITVYGYDLTGKTEIPMCYVAMNAAKWRQIFPEQTLVELLDKLPNASSDDWNKWWSVDQKVLTKRLLANGVDKFIDRGFDGGLARGRVDRYDWNGTLNKPGEKIDAHMPRPYDESACEKIISLIK
jgi:hypothetical protein